MRAGCEGDSEGEGDFITFETRPNLVDALFRASPWSIARSILAEEARSEVTVSRATSVKRIGHSRDASATIAGSWFGEVGIHQMFSKPTKREGPLSGLAGLKQKQGRQVVPRD